MHIAVVPGGSAGVGRATIPELAGLAAIVPGGAAVARLGVGRSLVGSRAA
jgi:hypothetical protein